MANPSAYDYASNINSHTASDIIQKLNLSPHPEKGYYIETYRDTTTDTNNRPYSTEIFYLLEGRDNASKWHRVDAVEVWHYYAGAPLKLELASPTTDSDNSTSSSDSNPGPKYNLTQKLLGQDIFADQRPQVVIDRHVWQRATSQGDWTLVGCTVAPGFVMEGFEMAQLGWEPKN
jgi:predicted cupin superfamily sugar epimerase